MMRSRIGGVFTAFVVAVIAASSGCGKRGQSAEEMARRVESERGRGDYTKALDSARRLLAAQERHEDGCELDETRRLIEMLGEWSALPESLQEKLAEADRLRAQADEVSSTDAAKAAGFLERSLAIRRQVLGPQHPEVSRALSDLGRLLANRAGDYEGAAERLREALYVTHESPAGNPAAVALNELFLADVLLDLGDLETADSLYQSAKAFYADVCGTESQGHTAVLARLATLRLSQGDYKSAEPLYRRSLANLEVRGDTTSELRAGILNDYGRLLYDIGDYPAAEEIYSELAELDRRHAGIRSQEYASTLANLAAAIDANGDPLVAETHYLQAIEIFRAQAEPDREALASVLQSLALAYSDRSKHDKAEPLHREALQMFREMHGAASSLVATATLGLARELRQQGRHEESDTLYREALGVFQRSLGPEHIDVARILYSYGSLCDDRGDYVRAESLYARAAAVYEVSRTRVGLGLARATFQEPPYGKLANARLHLERQLAAWEATEKAQGRVLAELLLSANRRGLSEEESAIEDSLRIVLDESEAEVAAHELPAQTGATGVDDAAVADARRRLLLAQAAWSELEQSIAARSPVAAGDAYPLERIQKSLERDAAIIGWLDVEERPGQYATWVYLLRRNGPVRWVRIQEAPAGARPADVVTAFRNALEVPGSITDLQREATRLWPRFSFIQRELEGVHRLVVIPSGAMLGIPVEAIVDADGVALADRYEVSYAPSATVYAWLVEKSGTRPGERAISALVLGDPKSPAGEGSNRGKRGEGSPEKQRMLRSALAGNVAALDQLGELPGSRAEAEQIARCFDKATVLLGDDARESSLEQMARSGELVHYGILHFATHGVADDERPERSMLVLSRVGLPDPMQAAVTGQRVEDGVVTAREIVRTWKLDADLVTLSACSSGLGKRVESEGYVGLAQAFFQAGARSLVVSLWPVDDEATSLLMQRFYQNLTGRESTANGIGGDTAIQRQAPMFKSAALREAKTWLRNHTEKGERIFEHPSYWSAFVLFGDPRPL